MSPEERMASERNEDLKEITEPQKQNVKDTKGSTATKPAEKPRRPNWQVQLKAPTSIVSPELLSAAVRDTT